MIHDSAPCRAQELVPHDSALIGREAGNALRWIYRGVASEPLLHRFVVQLVELAAKEGRDDADRRNRPL